MIRLRILCGVILLRLHFVLTVVVETVKEKGQHLHQVSKKLPAALATMATKVFMMLK
jgi:hypothetical protein